MRKLVGVAIIATCLVAVLAGCSSPKPVTPADVSVTLSTSSTTDLLTGDSLPVQASVSVAHKKPDRVQLTIQKSSDGKSWSDVASVKGMRKLSESVDVKLTAAGTYFFRGRVSALGEKGRVLRTTKAASASVADIKTLIRTSAYDSTQAWQRSSQAGVDFETAHDYPGTFDTASPTWASGVAQIVSNDYRYSTVADLDTVSPAPDWKLSAGKCNAAQTAPPKGRTFVVTVEAGYGAGSPTIVNKADMHFTYLDGELYHYLDFCE